MALRESEIQSAKMIVRPGPTHGRNVLFPGPISNRRSVDKNELVFQKFWSDYIMLTDFLFFRFEIDKTISHKEPETIFIARDQMMRVWYVANVASANRQGQSVNWLFPFAIKLNKRFKTKICSNIFQKLIF